MTKYTTHQPQSGYMTGPIRTRYIDSAIEKELLPSDAHRMEAVVSLIAPDDPQKPIQFWQLYSVMGAELIIAIVEQFYKRVFSDEAWFKSVFERGGSEQHHIHTQSSMWLDVMGGGHHYHGAEFRLDFHHTHNAVQLMNERGVERWVDLMRATLDSDDINYTDDARVRPAINTFLTFFMAKYADDFKFKNLHEFGAINPRLIRRINFLNMTSDAIEALPVKQLRDELALRGIDITQYTDKRALVNKALSL